MYYLTYDEYQQYGGTLDETAYQDVAFEAQSVINWWTFNRLQSETEYPEAVKRCMFKLMSLIAERQKAMVVDALGDGDTSTTKAGIASESNDGVSTSYNTLSAKEAIDNLKKEYKSVVRMYLQGVKDSLGRSLLYRGVYPNE